MPCHICKPCRQTAGCKSKLPKLSRKMVKIYVVVFLTMFNSTFSVTMVFPFLPFMVEFLLPWLTEREELIATYAGIVASAPFFGRIFGSYLWGAIADRKGRKPVIIVSLILIGLTSAIFGFSVSFEMAVILRLLAGFSNGVVGTLKAVISEVSDDSTQAFGVSLVGTAWGLGIIIGPAVSGTISDPIGQYNLTIENDATREFLTRFPFSLPCLLSAFFCTASAVLTILFLPETLGVKKNRKRSEIALLGEDASPIISPSEQPSSTRPETVESMPEFKASATSCDAPLTNDKLDCDSSNGTSISILKLESAGGSVHTDEEERIENCSDSEVATDGNVSDLDGISTGNLNLGYDNKEILLAHREPLIKVKGHMKKSLISVKDSLRNVGSFLCDRSAGLSLLAYAVFSSIDIAFNDIYSVWAKTSPHLGGLGFSLNDIGVTLTISCVVILPVSLILFPILEKRIGTLCVFYSQSVILIPAVMLLPNAHYLYKTKWLVWALVCTTLTVIQACLAVGFNSQIIFINNSVTFDKLGSVNGLGTSLTACTRAVAPLAAGAIFSFSLSAGLGYPFDYRLVFLIFGLVFVLCVFLVTCLPVSINKQKVIEDVQ